MPDKKESLRSKKHLARYVEILKALIKYGFEDIADSLRKNDKSSISESLLIHDKSVNVKELARWQRVRMMLEDLGTTFIKLGQMLSGRPDLIPEELIKELERLQDLTPTFDGNLAVRRIEEELGQPVGDLFLHFELVPLASASIGQVHAATLHDGRRVVVKVQRPDIQDQIEVDMDILRALAKLAEKYREEVRHYNPQAIVEALEKIMELELDFRHELKNIQLFRNNAAQRQSEVVVPEVYESLSSRRILTMEFVEGFKINNLNAYLERNISPQEVAKKAINSYFEQIFVDGFFHADPHPGNVFVDPHGNLIYLDFGMMGKLPERDKQLLGDLFIAVEMRDSDKILQAVKSLSKISFIEDEAGLLHEIELLLNNYYASDLEDISL